MTKSEQAAVRRAMTCKNPRGRNSMHIAHDAMRALSEAYERRIAAERIAADIIDYARAVAAQS